MKNVITPKIWYMESTLWLLPVMASVIFHFQGRSPLNGLYLMGLPLVITLIFGVCALFPNWWFRKEEDYPLIRKIFIMLIFFLYYISISVLLLLFSQGKWGHLYQKMLGVGIGLFFILLGNIMPKLRRNRLVGIRLPWTMTDDEVWRKVHYWGGIETVIAGITTVIASLIFPIGRIKMMFVVLPILLLWAIVSAFHSYLIAKHMKSTDD